jgi:hypothetical protein
MAAGQPASPAIGSHVDAVTLYAESLTDLHPWKLWSLDGRPTEGTQEILTVLERVLQRDPNHLDANHYHIHAVEASHHPEWSLVSAHRLETLAPAAGHLVAYARAHIYACGHYSAAAHSTAGGADVNSVYLRESATTGGVYDMMYYCHNLHFLAAAASMAGDFARAKQAAGELAAHVGPMVHGTPMAEVYVPTPISMAETERSILEVARKETAADTEFSFYSNKAQTFLGLAAKHTGCSDCHCAGRPSTGNPVSGEGRGNPGHTLLW